jgi:hypothetical protein
MGSLVVPVWEGLVVGFPGPEVADPTRGNNLVVGITGAQRFVLLPITGEHLVPAQQQRDVLLSTRVADPVSIGSVDPVPDSESGSGSRRAKMTNKCRKQILKFMF